MSDTSKMNAFDQGAHAHADGVPYVCCPFDPKTENEKYTDWHAGWLIHEQNEERNRRAAEREA
jgi:hypothetical protein